MIYGNQLIHRMPLLFGCVTLLLMTTGPRNVQAYELVNDLDMWEEMTLAALLHEGVLSDPATMPAQAGRRGGDRAGSAGRRNHSWPPR